MLRCLCSKLFKFFKLKCKSRCCDSECNVDVDDNNNTLDDDW